MQVCLTGLAFLIEPLNVVVINVDLKCLYFIYKSE